jgi:hypothetical protein
MKIKSRYATTYHRDNTVTIWDVYQQAWVRLSHVTDHILHTLGDAERERVKRHTGAAR